MTSAYKKQFIPLFFTFVTFIVLWLILFLFIRILNLLPTQEKIALVIRKRDILVGLTIYLKTSIDFAIFIGNLMRANRSWKSRIAIEVGTALGNAGGTLVVLLIWTFFKEVPLLMFIMIFIASLVLLKMAEESFKELIHTTNFTFLKSPIVYCYMFLTRVNVVTEKLLGKIIPNVKITNAKSMSFIPLAIFAFTIPFLLGLDDFAGYIPLFSVVNVYGFAIGVFLGHMILNAALFLSPSKTIALVKLPIILFIGGFAFVGIALLGFIEIVKILYLYLW